MKKILSLFAILAMFLLAPSHLRAQDVSGMTGTVTDSSGAAIPGVTVTLTNKLKGLKYTVVTGNDGSYRFNNVPPGQGYEAHYTRSGFATYDVNTIYLTVATTRTQNAVLAAGADVQIQVSASNSEVTINTTDATIGNNFDVKLLNDLPVQQRNSPVALFTLQPGVTDSGSVTGARVDQNNITLDGLDVNDFATGGGTQSGTFSSSFDGSIVGGAPVDSIEQFRGTVGGNTAVSGPASGGQFQLVTKSGTNRFHGNINEYHRDPSLVANSWFSNNASPIIPRNHLIQNQFGGNIGGPILKNKLFFFFNYLNSRVISTAVGHRTVPLDTLRAGIVQYTDSNGNVDQLMPSDIQGLDPAGIGESPTFQAAYDARFPHSNTAGGDGLNSGGYIFNAPADDFTTSYVGKVDYNLNSTMKLYGRLTILRENAIETLDAFGGDGGTNPFVDRTYSFVVGHDWQIGNRMTNRLFLGETVQKVSFPVNQPKGNPIPAEDLKNQLVFDDGTGAALTSPLYNAPDPQSRRVPIPEIGDDFTWSRGNHTFQFGGTFKDIRAKNDNVADFNSVQVGLGGHTLNLCGPVAGDCGTTAGVNNPSLRPSNISTDAGDENLYDQAFAFTLARVGEVSADFNYNAAGDALPQLTGDQRIYQYYQTQLYAADTWKIVPSLTLSLGLNYQLFSVPYETRGLESTEVQSFNQYFGARQAQSAAGETGANAVPLISYVLGGKANNGPPLYQPEHHDFAPRFGFSYNPGFDKQTVFNGSVGMVYDRTIVNAIQFQQDADSYLFQQTLPIDEGISGDPYNSIRTDPRLDSNNGLGNVPITPPATPKPPYEPFVQNGVPIGLQLGSAFNTTIDPTLKTPYSIAYNFGMQRAMPGNFVLKLSYAGRLGRRLLAQADANQIIDFPDKTSGQLLSQAFANITQERRAGAPITVQPWFENIVTPGLGVAQGYSSNTAFLVAALGGLVSNGDFGDFVEAISGITPLNVGSAAQFSENTFFTNKGFSSYNALLASLQKNLSHGLQFDVNYTFSHSIDNVSLVANGQGDTGIGGVGLVCDVVRPRECRANSDFDVTNQVTADVTYQLPFGRGRQFANNIPGWANEVIGGWDISGITDVHSGLVWGTNSDAFDAGYSNDAPGILVGPKSDVAIHLTKLPGGGVNLFRDNATAANAYIGPIGFQIGARNSLRGAKYFDQDLGLAKTFPIYTQLNLKFRADAFNAFNHPNFDIPEENGFNGFDNQDILNPTFGQVTDTIGQSGNNNEGARVLQLSLRLEF